MRFVSVVRGHFGGTSSVLVGVALLTMVLFWGKQMNAPENVGQLLCMPAVSPFA